MKISDAKARSLDQFYTNPKIASLCFSWLKKEIPISRRQFFLEPSAGDGSFLSLLDSNKSVGLDLHPKKEGILKKDFLKSSPDKVFPFSKNKSVAIGNPPFGKNSSLAIKFFNHATVFADTIAFVVPRTFKKESVHQKLNRNYWLVFSKDLPKKSFLFQGIPYDVPCCFQIWVKKEEQRKDSVEKPSSIFDFVKKEESDIAVRRVGGRTGKAILDPRPCSKSSHYFLKIKDSSLTPENLVELINTLDFSKEATSTAGVKSISKGEFLRKTKALKPFKKSI